MKECQFGFDAHVKALSGKFGNSARIFDKNHYWISYNAVLNFDEGVD